jgi:hypothetical protein
VGIIKAIYFLIRAFLISRLNLAAEILALRPEVAVYKHTVKRPNGGIVRNPPGLWHAKTTPAEDAHRSTSTCLLGDIVLQLGREPRWDPAAERFLDEPEADRLLGYAMRVPWNL